MQDLLSRIYRRHYRDGRLPAQRDLAREYGVSRYTVQEAIKMLEDIGAVESVQGSGVYVRDKLRVNPLVFNSLTRVPYARVESRMLELSCDPADKEQRLMFSLDEGERVWRFSRVRTVNHVLEQIESSCVPQKLFPEMTREVVEGSIQRFVEQSGYRISHYLTTYSATTTTGVQSKILACRRHTPAMQIINHGILTNGAVFEYSEIVALEYTVSYIRPFNREHEGSRRSDSAGRR